MFYLRLSFLLPYNVHVLHKRANVILYFRYSGVLFGITNTVATIPGMVAPIIAGHLTPNVSRGFLSLVYCCNRNILIQFEKKETKTFW